MTVVKEGFVQEVIGRYDGDPGMLIPMMQDLQAEYGYLPPEELRRLARELGTPLTRVYGIAMFYSSFRLSPKGLHEVTLCMGTVCYLKGAPKISEAICEEYGIKPGGTTTDRLFTLQAVNCVGACALAPVMVVDGKYYDGVTPDLALKVLRGFGETAAEAGASEQAPPEGEANESAGIPRRVKPAPAAPAPTAAAPAAEAAKASVEAPKVPVEAPKVSVEPGPAIEQAPAPEPAPKRAAAKKTGAPKTAAKKGPAAKKKPSDKKKPKESAEIPRRADKKEGRKGCHSGGKPDAKPGKPSARKRSRP